MTPPPVDPRLAELSDLLVGTWRIHGPGIEGLARYRTVRDGHLLVGEVEVDVGEATMKNLQHIGFDVESGTLRARYLDTYGGDETYTWVLEHPHLRVSLDGPDSGTYFEARVSADRSEYHGTWHYADQVADPAEPPEEITYTRLVSQGR